MCSFSSSPLSLLYIFSSINVCNSYGTKLGYLPPSLLFQHVTYMLTSQHQLHSNYLPKIAPICALWKYQSLTSCHLHDISFSWNYIYKICKICNFHLTLGMDQELSTYTVLAIPYKHAGSNVVLSILPLARELLLLRNKGRGLKFLTLFILFIFVIFSTL